VHFDLPANAVTGLLLSIKMPLESVTRTAARCRRWARARGYRLPVVATLIVTGLFQVVRSGAPRLATGGQRLQTVAGHRDRLRVWPYSRNAPLFEDTLELYRSCRRSPALEGFEHIDDITDFPETIGHASGHGWRGSQRLMDCGGNCNTSRYGMGVVFDFLRKH
jgi:hypothetical protein